MSSRNFATPINTFEHPETGSIIDIVSLIHIGEERYYRQLGAHIMNRQDEGFIVQYERISFNPDAPTVDPSMLTKLKDKIDDKKTDASAGIDLTLERTTNWVSQDDAWLFRLEGAQNIDLDHSDIVPKEKLIPKLYQLLSFTLVYRKVARMAKKDPAELEQFIFKKLKKVADADNAGKRKRKSPLTIDARNEVALAGVDAALEADAAERIVLVWGLGHLAGLSAGLIDRGYEHIERQEVVVATDRRGLDQDLEKSRKDLARANAKLAERQARAARKASQRQDRTRQPSSYSMRLDSHKSAFEQIDKDIKERQKAMEKRLAEDRKRREETWKKFEVNSKFAPVNSSQNRGRWLKRKKR